MGNWLADEWFDQARLAPHHWLPRAGGAGSHPVEAPRDRPTGGLDGHSKGCVSEGLAVSLPLGQASRCSGGRTRSGRRGALGAHHWQGTRPAEAKRFGRESARLLYADLANRLTTL